MVPELRSPFGLVLSTSSSPDQPALFAVEPRQGEWTWWSWEVTGGLFIQQTCHSRGPGFPRATLCFRASFLRLPPQVSQPCPALGSRLLEPRHPVLSLLDEDPPFLPPGQARATLNSSRM